MDEGRLRRNRSYVAGDFRNIAANLEAFEPKRLFRDRFPSTDMIGRELPLLESCPDGPFRSFCTSVNRHITYFSTLLSMPVTCQHKQKNLQAVEAGRDRSPECE